MVMIVLCITLIATPLLARGGGGGGGGGGNGGGGNGGSGNGGDGFSRDRGAMSSQSQSRSKSQLTDQQRTQINDCQSTTNRMLVQIREMAELTSGQALQAGRLEKSRLTLRNEFQQLEGAQANFVSGLTSRDRDQLRDRLHDMDRDRDRLRTCLQDLENQLAQPNPDPTRLRQNIKDMEQAMERWQSHYTQLQ